MTQAKKTGEGPAIEEVGYRCVSTDHCHSTEVSVAERLQRLSGYLPTDIPGGCHPLLHGQGSNHR